MVDFLSIDKEAFNADLQSVDVDLLQMEQAIRELGREGVEQLEREILGFAREKAGGEVLAVHSGRFLASIQGDVQDLGQGNFEGEVYSNDPSASLLEYGGDVRGHEIDPHAGVHALRFAGDGGISFAAHVNWPGSHVRPHSTMRAAVWQAESAFFGGTIPDEFLDPEMLPGEEALLRAFAALRSGGESELEIALADLQFV